LNHGPCTGNLDPGGAIRTISVSLLAVVAVIAGVLLSRTRQPPAAEIKDDGIERPAVSLEELRRAGF
jgi:hypothetical protein